MIRVELTEEQAELLITLCDKIYDSMAIQIEKLDEEKQKINEVQDTYLDIRQKIREAQATIDVREHND